EKTIKSEQNENEKALEKDRKVIIAKDTKAYDFIQKILLKLKAVDQKDIERYIKELHDSICGIYKAAVKVTDRTNKEFEARTRQIDSHIEKHNKEIEQKEQKISQLMSQKDYIMVETKKTGADDQLLLKVKKEIGLHTVIKGEVAQLVVDKSIHGVLIRERDATSKKEAHMVIDGYFG
ncbi:MAG: hypothetical protein L3J69_16310, partial [Desulfobacula sp.]|nr:hypothetical protein [Desulfobacula sp.]